MDQAINQETTKKSFVTVPYILGLSEELEEYLRTLKSK